MFIKNHVVMILKSVCLDAELDIMETDLTLHVHMSGWRRHIHGECIEECLVEKNDFPVTGVATIIVEMNVRIYLFFAMNEQKNGKVLQHGMPELECL